MDGQTLTTTITTLEPLANNLTATNLLLLKQTTIEEELLKRQQQVDEIRLQVEKLKQLESKNPKKSMLTVYKLKRNFPNFFNH